LHPLDLLTAIEQDHPDVGCVGVGMQSPSHGSSLCRPRPY
jgi:hypothetical protein